MSFVFDITEDEEFTDAFHTLKRILNWVLFGEGCHGEMATLNISSFIKKDFKVKQSNWSLYANK